MSETIYYKLHITDDSSETFNAFRNAMNGPVDSNMVKIDKALSEKADKSTVILCTLFANAWGGLEAPFTQVLKIDGLTAECNGIISLASTATFEQRDSARCALLAQCGQTDGELTVVADGELPEQDIPVQITLYG